jgi:hypothetical protein
VEAYHKEHEAALKLLERDLDSLKEFMFKQSQELFKLRKEEANLVAEVTQSTFPPSGFAGICFWSIVLLMRF